MGTMHNGCATSSEATNHPLLRPAAAKARSVQTQPKSNFKDVAFSIGSALYKIPGSTSKYSDTFKEFVLKA